jgi:tetratricopeptide (TPR) repeat protein
MTGDPRPFRSPRAPSPRKPRLPSEVPRLQRGVYKEIQRAAKPDAREDALKALGAASEALDTGDAARAVELLVWLKSVASRSPAVREALGIAQYHAGDFAAAHSELLAYRRMSGRQDQNHLLADCARAQNRPEKVSEYVHAMEGADDVPADRWSEALIVHASDRADRGDVAGALAIIERGELNPVEVATHHLRLWYVAADLHQRAGNTEQAADFLEAILAVDEDYLDAAERLQALSA